MCARRLALLIRLLVPFALLAGACSSDDEPNASDDGPAETADGESPGDEGTGEQASTTTQLPAELDPNVVSDPDGTPGAAPGSNTDASAVSDELRRSVGAPQPGRYEYKLGGDDSEGTQVFVDVLDRDPEFQRPDAVVQIWLRRTHHEGTARILVFGADGVTETDEYRFRDDGSFRRCLWKPAILELPADPEPGDTWEWDSECTDPDREVQASATARRQGSATIADRRNADVFDFTFDVWSIDFTEADVFVAGSVPVRDERSLEVWWSTEYFLPVQYQGTVGTVIGGESQGIGGSLDRIVTDPAEPLPAEGNPAFRDA